MNQSSRDKLYPARGVLLYSATLMTLGIPMKSNPVAVTSITAAALAASGQSMAAGFYLTQAGTPMSVGTVGVTNTVNTWGPDAVWSQPAGMVNQQDDLVGVAGVSVLLPSIKFDSSVAEAGGRDGGNAGEVVAIPSAFLVKKISDKTAVGLGLSAPQGGAMDFGDDFVGRYVAQKVELQGVGISTSVGYEVNDDLAVGAGVSFVYTQFEQEIAINLPGPAPDGKATLDDLDNWGYQPFLVLTYDFSEQLMLGVVYRAEMEVELEGDLDIDNAPPPGGDAKIEWDNPQWLEAALRYEFEKDYFVTANLGWQDWSAFSENEVTVAPGAKVLDRNWKDTWRVGLAFAHFDGLQGWSTGISCDSSPVSDSDRSIDLAMDETLQAGASYFVKSDSLSYSFGSSLMYIGDGKVDQTSQGVRFKGEFDTNVIATLTATTRYTF